MGFSLAIGKEVESQAYCIREKIAIARGLGSLAAAADHQTDHSVVVYLTPVDARALLRDKNTMMVLSQAKARVLIWIASR